MALRLRAFLGLPAAWLCISPCCEVGIALQRADVSAPPSRDPRWLQDVPKAVVQPACRVLVTSRAGADFLCRMPHLPLGGVDPCRRKSPASVSCSTEAPKEGYGGVWGRWSQSPVPTMA